ncbi:MAG TPA: hypothetical protein VIF60_25150 [Burkholderiaceae bacterium]
MLITRTLISRIFLPALISLAACLAPAQAAEEAGVTRYVWASNLTLRAQPDGSSTALAKLPFGTTVALLPASGQPVPHRETLLKLEPGNGSPAADVILDGTWRQVHAGANDGWVFDAYLSRYPVRQFSIDKNKHDDESEAEFARRVFGAKLVQNWQTGASKKSADYAAMLKHSKMAPKNTVDNVSWEYVEFQAGGTYEMLATQPMGGMYTSTIDFKDVPLTYGEALLWLKQFGGFEAIGGNGAIGKFSGKVEPGRHLEIGATDDDTSGFGFARSIDCHASTCSINYGFSD